ncbi:hypothetical protein QZN11_33630 [Streptomyces gramineus]|uniref:hypothetical protein n=1 Tax=Streptomyces gramineus TaxID=910542 RepID=UPI00398AAF06
MTDARTGNDRQSMSGDIDPGDEATPGREDRTGDEAAAGRRDPSAARTAAGREDVAAGRTDGLGEPLRQAVLVAGDGPGHSAEKAPTGRRTPDEARDVTKAEDHRPTATQGDRTPQADRTAQGDRTVNGDRAAHGEPLMAKEECGQLEQRLQHALTEFVDEPRAAVEEADRAVEELSARFTDAIDRRRRTLRGSWQETDRDHPGSADTEQLRLALRDYRELADRLLHI